MQKAGENNNNKTKLKFVMKPLFPYPTHIKEITVASKILAVKKENIKIIMNKKFKS